MGNFDIVSIFADRILSQSNCVQTMLIKWQSWTWKQRKDKTASSFHHSLGHCGYSRLSLRLTPCAGLWSQKFGSKIFSRAVCCCVLTRKTLCHTVLFPTETENNKVTGAALARSKLQRGLACCLESESFISLCSRILFASRPCSLLSVLMQDAREGVCARVSQCPRELRYGGDARLW